MAERRAYLKVCDACGAENEHSRDEYALGIHLKGSVHLNAGGGPLKVYACSFACLSLAAEIAYVRDWHGNDDWEDHYPPLAKRAAEAWHARKYPAAT